MQTCGLTGHIARSCPGAGYAAPAAAAPLAARAGGGASEVRCYRCNGFNQ